MIDFVDCRTVQRKRRASTLGNGFNRLSNPIDGADLAARCAKKPKSVKTCAMPAQAAQGGSAGPTAREVIPIYVTICAR